MPRIFLLILAITLAPVTAWADAPSLIALIDKACYLTGERLQVSLSLDSSDPSVIAYVEIADNEHLFAQTMVQLQAGRGWAEISLPQSMHSGNYTVTAYTRHSLAQGLAPHSQIISVVNVGHVTRADRITFLQPDSTARPVPYRTYRSGETIEAIAPVEARNARVLTLSLSSCELQIPDYTSLTTSFTLPSAVLPLEYEGHVVASRVVGNHQVNQAYLSRVGKDAYLVEGQQVGEGRWNFYTRSLNGRVATSLTAVNFDGNTIPMDFISPYAKLLPQSPLPALTVACTDQQLRDRNLCAQREQMLVHDTPADTVPHSMLFMGDEPQRFYDLDEWRRFSSVREIILEFLSAVHRRRESGVNFLHVYDPAINQVSPLPALVLLDGMPVYDIDRFLEYDARLLKYVQIYQREYAFGNLLYHGVISFISIRGRLANYKLEAGTQLVNYEYPQLCPEFQAIAPNTRGTLYWNPDVRSATQPVVAPDRPDLYLLQWQWVDAAGQPHSQRGYIEVKQ